MAKDIQELETNLNHFKSRLMTIHELFTKLEKTNADINNSQKILKELFDAEKSIKMTIKQWEESIKNNLINEVKSNTNHLIKSNETFQDTFTSNQNEIKKSIYELFQDEKENIGKLLGDIVDKYDNIVSTLNNQTNTLLKNNDNIMVTLKEAINKFDDMFDYNKILRSDLEKQNNKVIKNQRLNMILLILIIILSVVHFVV